MAGEPKSEQREAELEHAAERYRTALDAGDMRAVGQVLHEAIDDPDLDRRISEINREAEREMCEEFYDAKKPSLYPGPGEFEKTNTYDPEDLIW